MKNRKGHVILAIVIISSALLAAVWIYAEKNLNIFNNDTDTSEEIKDSGDFDSEGQQGQSFDVSKGAEATGFVTPSISPTKTESRPSQTPDATQDAAISPVEQPVATLAPSDIPITENSSISPAATSQPTMTATPLPSEQGQDTLQTGDPVAWSDPDFEAAIHDVLGIRGYLYEEDLLEVTSLDLSGRRLTNISDISKFVNLTELDLSWNEIVDISPVVSTFMLTKLDLSYNLINEVSVLGQLADLENLYVGNNYISDISSFSALLSLKELGMEYNNISDLSALSGLSQLNFIMLEGNPLTDYTPVDFVEHVY